MIDPATLRRPVRKALFDQIKEDQRTMNRFEVAVKHQLSLVPVRFAFQSHNFEQFKALMRRGLVFESGTVEQRIRKARIMVSDLNFVEESIEIEFN